MSDLIDRQELLKHKGNCYDEEGHLLYAVGTGTILLMPTVEAEPVVRCKDCKHYIADGCDECQLMIAKSIIASINDKRWYSDFYCAWGERREDGEH